MINLSCRLHDPSSVMIYLNDELIPYDTSIITYTISETNPKVTVDFTPALSDGDYELKVLWKNSSGNIVDSSGVKKFFLISSKQSCFMFTTIQIHREGRLTLRLSSLNFLKK
jgi:hypothetical protein